jgi:hypothetical protein
MDRQIVYPGQILPETSLLQMTKDPMIGMAKLASALLGTSTYASGFAVTPTGPASLQVVYAPGEIYSLASIDALAFSTLPADTTHSILKQGILLDGGTLNCPAPGTTGQSINYLVQVTYQDSDASPVLLPYYNSSNPAMPYSGQGNNGLTQNTVRKGVAVVSVKAGASATTGSQTTPAPDAGYIGLYVVTVAFGQTTITSGNIAVLSTAPLINSTLHGLSPVFTANPVVPTATLPGHAMPLGQAVGRLIGVQVFTSSGTYTPSAGTTSVVIEVLGAGASGGATAATAAGQCAAGGGGGAGAYGKSRLTTGFSGVAVTVGLGGAAPAAGANSGNNGGSSSFGSLLVCLGGTGGGGSTAIAASGLTGPNGGNQGLPIGANLCSSGGMAGGNGFTISATQPLAGKGGDSIYGVGGHAPTSGGGARAAFGYGSGSSGVNAGPSNAAQAGLPGMPGIVLVWEYA